MFGLCALEGAPDGLLGVYLSNASNKMNEVGICGMNFKYMLYVGVRVKEEFYWLWQLLTQGWCFSLKEKSGCKVLLAKNLTFL